MYKLVAIDLDGTLLNSYGEVSSKNKQAIEKAEKQGTKVVIASGRPLSSVSSFANESEQVNTLFAEMELYYMIPKITKFYTRNL